ncbi:MAG: Lrp/AsnC family transcriptional regulator [Burkholderiales bacterium]|nr:Lrp/AsnC family transcriptional regulator [Burkholderiales bacterium]
MSAADLREARLLNEFQHGFPLVPQPFAAIGTALGADDAWVRGTLARAQQDGRVSRVGAVFRPGTIGVSTLAALAVPTCDLERVAAAVSARPEVNHNYEREHRYNLWFVATAPDRAALDLALAAIGRDTGLAPLSLPMLCDYWIDLGFDLDAPHGKVPGASPSRARGSLALDPAEWRIVAALERGLPLVRAPYAALAAAAGVAESVVLDTLADWLSRGVIKRLGVVVRHRALGFTANAMCVWDLPDGLTDAAGAALAREPGVTLCYRRARALPAWRYNLFCMLHGRDRAVVEARRGEIVAAHGLARYPSATLFSRRAFKQRGARYAARVHAADAPLPA